MAFVIAILAIVIIVGLVLKLAKVAIILALLVGGVMLVQNKLGGKRLK